jgi:hypothetical protein
MGDKISFSAPQPQLEALLTKLRDAVGSAGSVQSIKHQGREYVLQYMSENDELNPWSFFNHLLILEGVDTRRVALSATM